MTEKKIVDYAVACTPTPNWYCVREIYEDGDFKAVGNGTLKRCKTWVLGMQTLLEVENGRPGNR